MKQITQITLPDGMTFSDLQLARNSTTGDVSFSASAVERIEAASGLPQGFFMGQDEDALGSLIATWYATHLQAGGARDPVADDILAEVRAEDAAGQPFSHAPGLA